MAENSGGGFTVLFSKLCEISFNKEANNCWDIYRRPRFTDQRQRALKVCLYETLFEELRAPWVSKLTRTRHKNKHGNSLFCVGDKLSVVAFKLRLARRFDDADKLDRFVRVWRNQREQLSSAIDFSISERKTGLENDATLRFLVALSGSAANNSSAVLGHKGDSWSKVPRKILKTSLPQGPLLITDSQLLRQRALDFDHYVHYSRELFECPPVLRTSVCDAKEKAHQTELQIFEELPGTFPGKARFFSRQHCSEDVFEKDGSTTLFSALVHSRTDDMDVKLNLPHLPSGSNTLHSLATEQRENADDEGFESLETSSNSSTSSEHALFSQESDDIWSAALQLPSQKYYTWEIEGRCELLNERPYLSEAGPVVFDALYDTVIRQVSYIVKSPSLSHNMISLDTLIKDSVNVLIGVPSRTYHLDKVTHSFRVSDQIRLSGTSPEMLGSILGHLAAMGTDYIQLNKFAIHQRGHTAGLVLQALLGALQNYLQCYRATVLSVNAASVQSPLQLTFAFEKLAGQLRFLANVCMCSQAFKKAPHDPKVKFPTGVKLLTYLYQLCLEHSSSMFYPILLSLLKHSVMPYIMFVQTWVFKGVCHDMFGEFMIEMDEQYLAYRDKHFWTHGFVMTGRDKLDCVPLFLGELADDIFVCGKTINLLKLCCPEPITPRLLRDNQSRNCWPVRPYNFIVHNVGEEARLHKHLLCDPGVSLPKMEVTFSMRRLNKLEDECKQYIGTIQRMNNQRQKQIENERKAIEDEKQRAMLEERETTEKALSEITELIQKAKDAVEMKKREDLKMLKEQMEDAFKHKALAKKEEQEADAKYLQEAQNREVTTASIEDELKQKAREDLIKYYEELTREVEYREFRAQWRIRRRELDTTRAQFLAQEQARLDSLKGQMAKASGAQTPSKSEDITVAQPGKEGDLKVASDSKVQEAPSSVWVPSPSLVSLIASRVRSDAMLRSEQQRNTAELAKSVGNLQTGVLSGNVRDEQSDEQSPGPSSDAPVTDNKVRKTWDRPDESVDELGKLKEEGTGRKTWETPDGEIKIVSSLPKSHPSDSSVQFAMYGEKRKSTEEAQTSDSNARDDTIKTGTPHVADSSLQKILYPNTPSVETGVDTQASNLIIQPSESDVSDLVMHHSSDSSAQDILYGGSAIPASSAVRTPSAQGHPSDSSAQHLLYSGNALERANVEARFSDHGHPSDSSVGNLLYSSSVDTPTPHSSRLSTHGHPSDSYISLSQDISKAQILHHSSRSTWQHPSDASVQKLLSDINILGESQETTRGAPPASVAQDILYPNSNAQSESFVSRTRGTPPQSVTQDILYPKGEEVGLMRQAAHTRGGPPSSVIQDIMYPSGEGTVEDIRMSTRGHEPEVKITKILYYAKDDEGKKELEPQSKQLEFEDVWMASQVEPLRDNFDLLGGVKLLDSLSRSTLRSREPQESTAQQLSFEKSHFRISSTVRSKDEKPSSDLLHGALGTFPSTQDSDDEDTDAAQLMSLPVLLQRSVMAPVLAQLSLVNSAIVAYFMDDLQINQHFNLFKKLLLMEDGEFSLSLSNQLFDKLASGVSPQEMCSATVMNGIVGKALQLSVYSDITEHAQNLAFALKSLPEIFKPNEMGTLDFLELRYRVDWPLNIVITEKSVVRYNKIFSFMLRLKRLSWVLRDIWFHLKHIACSRNAAMSPQLRQLQLFRHEMQHFVHNLEGYLSNQILNVTWSEFQEGLLNVRSLDDLHNQHAEYLRKAIFRSLLSPKAAPVMTIISDLGTLILKLRTQLLASAWQQDPRTGHVTHPAFDVMCNTHKAFKEYSGFLFTVVSKLVHRGYQSHLADFLLRINFNDFYNVGT